jgi:hypothetical protein
VDRLAIVKIEVELPEAVWLTGYTRDHPDLLIDIHNLLPVADHNLLGDFEILGLPVDPLTEIAGFPDVREVSPLDVPPEAQRFRVLFRETLLVSLLVKLGILVRYPTSARNGVASFETVDRISQIRRLLASLRRAGFDVRIVSLRKEFRRTRLPELTPVQREMLRQALLYGYFHVPRRITLTRLAQKLARSKSTVSQTIAIIERKLVEAAYRATP